jgi:hypothetical protein
MDRHISKLAIVILANGSMRCGDGSASHGAVEDYRILLLMLLTAEEFLTQLNTDFRVSHNFEITWTIERDSAIFLDLNMFKGAGWLRCGLLDSMTYAKAMTRA